MFIIVWVIIKKKRKLIGNEFYSFTETVVRMYNIIINLIN